MTTSRIIPVTEAQAEKAVVQLFELYGWEVRRIREDITRGSAGLPDLLCVSPRGLLLWIEMKRPSSGRNPRGRVRKRQRETLTQWRRRGVFCCVADGVTEQLQRVTEFGQGHGNATWMLDVCDRLMADYDWWPRP